MELAVVANSFATQFSGCTLQIAVSVSVKYFHATFVQTLMQLVPCSVLRHYYGPWSARLEPQESRGQNGNSWNRVGASGNAYKPELK